MGKEEYGLDSEKVKRHEMWVWGMKARGKTKATVLCFCGRTQPLPRVTSAHGASGADVVRSDAV